MLKGSINSSGGKKHSGEKNAEFKFKYDSIAVTVAIALPKACFIILKIATMSTSGGYCMAPTRKCMENFVTHVNRTMLQAFC